MDLADLAAAVAPLQRQLEPVGQAFRVKAELVAQEVAQDSRQVAVVVVLAFITAAMLIPVVVLAVLAEQHS